MKGFVLPMFFTVIFSFSAKAQFDSFPRSWTGNWKGELNWYKTGQQQPQKVNMELRIHPTDSANNFSWQIIYGTETQDNRPYTLIAKDTAKGHWAIDENNGIVLDQFWIANKFCGAFTVQNSTIFNNYWILDDELIVEFYTIGIKPIATSGKGTENSPNVGSYKIGSYQKAVLRRTK